MGDKIVTGTESDDEELNKKLTAEQDAAPARAEDAAAADDPASAEDGAATEDAVAALKAVARTSVAAAAAATYLTAADTLDDNRFAEEIWKQ